MKKKVELPTAEPPFSTYQYYGNIGASIAPNSTVRNWFLNEAINLRCSKRFLYGHPTPELGVDKVSFDDNPCFDRQVYLFRCPSAGINVFIKSLLDNSYYIEFWNVDDYYIQGKGWYHERHTPHKGMICGYDDNDKTYTMLAYDNKWVFRRFKTPQAAWNKSVRSSFERGWSCTISAVKVKEETVALDIPRVYANLNRYLHSTVEGNLASNEEICIGVAVHDFLNMYLKRLENGSLSYDEMDGCILRLLWEHKKVMLERIRAVEKELSLTGEISLRYEDVVHTANHIRMLYAVHQRQRRDSVLPIIRKELMAIKKQEVSLLKQLLRELKPHI